VRLARTTILGLFLTACHVPVDEVVGRYKIVTRKPEKGDLVGTWVINQPTIDFMRTRGRYDVSRPTQIVLREDDTFDLTNMPDWYDDGFGESHGELRNLLGKWSLHNDGGWQIGLEAQRFAPLLVLREPRYASQPKYYLQIVIGDPDSGEDMIFVKQ
jgi:hypothetical protein